MTEETAEIRDQLGNDPEITPVINATHYEEILIEEGPLKIESRTIGNGFVLGHPTNGVLGAGGSNVLGSDYGSLVVESVTNNNSLYIERFKFTDFKDSSNTTANWDTSQGKVIF